MGISDKTLKQIRQEYNKESIFLMSAFPDKDVKTVSTGSLLLDDALGGGIPLGRYSEVYGPNSSGKTTLCQHIIAGAQNQGLNCCFIDVENAIDPLYAKACGVDFESLYLSQPAFAQEALGIAEMLIESGEVGVIIIDSIAALSPEKESEGKFEDKNVTGMHRAKLLNAFFRRTAKIAMQNEVAIVLTNQMRDNVNSFFGGYQTVGGHGVKHYASVRVSLWRDDVISDSDEDIGIRIEATVKKNKVAPPFKKAKFSILAGSGIEKSTDAFDTGLALGVIQQRHSYYKYDGETLAQGQAKTLRRLRDDPELVKSIRLDCGEILDAKDK